MPKRYIDADEYKANIESAIDGLMVQREFTPTTEVVPWEFLERYADWFCGSCSHVEFVRMAKLFWERENGEREETE